MHPFVGLAERTDDALDVLDEPERRAGLTAAGGPANRALLADFGQSAIQFGLSVHGNRDQTRVHRKRGPASAQTTRRP